MAITPKSGNQYSHWLKTQLPFLGHRDISLLADLFKKTTLKSSQPTPRQQKEFFFGNYFGRHGFFVLLNFFSSHSRSLFHNTKQKKDKNFKF